MHRWDFARSHRFDWLAMEPLSLVYAGILAARSAWWRRYARTSPLPTVSVGNLTVGGNGKTPFTLFLATRLRRRGLMIAIVGRGYRGQESRGPRLVSDGKHLRMTPRQAGDEPVMMAKSFEGPVAVARRRIDAIDLLATNCMAEAVVLDDGFQHVRLRRDCDLLVMNESIGLGNGRLLPAGPLRERPRALERCDALVLIKSFGAEPSSDYGVPDIMRGKPLLRARLEPLSLTYSENGIWHQTPLMLKGRHVVALSGVANPAAFHSMIDALGARLLKTLVYTDHYDYRSGDWEDIVSGARRAEMVITTEKDLVKLERLAPPGFPLYALRLEVVMEMSEEMQLMALVMERLSRASRAKTHTSEGEGGTSSGNKSRLA